MDPDQLQYYYSPIYGGAIERTIYIRGYIQSHLEAMEARGILHTFYLYINFYLLHQLQMFNKYHQELPPSVIEGAEVL